MTVRDLIQQLQTLDGSSLVVLSRDEEGNGFAPLRVVDECMKYKDGETGLEELTAEDVGAGFTDDDVMRGGDKAIVLYP